MFLQKDTFSKILASWKIILVLSGVCGLLSLLVSYFLLPVQYGADSQVLIISTSRYGVDPYTSVKSSERVGENLLYVLKSDDFYNKVMDQAGEDFDKSVFENLSDRKRRRAWEKSLSAGVSYGTGVLNIRSYGNSAEQAKSLSAAIMKTVVSKGWEYVGGDVTLKIINEPISTRFPVRPNILLNFIFGALIGGILMLFSLLFRQKHI